MGEDPATSVTDPDGRFHDVPNAYVAGPALFPTVGSPNPMLTGVALARRTAEAITAAATPISDAGFTALFDGRSLAGWAATGAGQFLVAGGALEIRGGPGLLWYRNQEFSDFLLCLDWLTTHDSDNSGIYLRIADPTAGGLTTADATGYEVQIDAQGAPDGAVTRRTGAIYALSAPQQDAARPTGTWNSYQIWVAGQQYTVHLNGTLVNDFTGSRRASGYIGLQSHHPGARVLFRNLRMQPL